MAARGFSLIEVLVAVVVCSIGFAAVFALQISTMQGNVGAREQGAAIGLAESNMESLRAEAYEWQAPGAPTRHLAADPLVWHTLSESGPVDHNGLPRVAAGAGGSALERQRFCVHYWLEPIDAGPFRNLINARVRVVWPRSTVDSSPVPAACTEEGAANFVPDVAVWNTVMLPGVLRMRD